MIMKKAYCPPKLEFETVQTKDIMMNSGVETIYQGNINFEDPTG